MKSSIAAMCVGVWVTACAGEPDRRSEVREEALESGGATPAVLCFTQGDASFGPASPAYDITGELAFENNVEQTRALLDHTLAPAGAYQRVKLTFVYQAALGTNQWRRQIALKLKAANSCNVIYVTWVFEKNGSAANSLEIKRKYTPSQWLDSQCGTEGYTTLYDSLDENQPLASPQPNIGDIVALEAELSGDDLQVWVNGVSEFHGVLAGLSSHAGWAGIRTDNVDGTVEVEASLDADASPTFVAARGFNGSGSSYGTGLPFSNSCYYLDAAGVERVGRNVPKQP